METFGRYPQIVMHGKFMRYTTANFIESNNHISCTGIVNSTPQKNSMIVHSVTVQSVTNDYLTIGKCGAIYFSTKETDNQ